MSPSYDERAAGRIGLQAALGGAVNLTRAQYEGHHDGTLDGTAALPHAPSRGFRIARVGQTDTARLQDVGIEYYCYS